MSDSPTGSGLDLARQSLAAYKATAKTAPAPKTARRTQRRIRGGEHRDPVTLGSTLNRVSAEQDWEVSLGGGDVLDRWAALCPQFADTVRPEGFDADKGTLILRPTSHTIAAGLRLLGGQLAKQINDKMGRTVVARIRILPVGAATSSPSTTADAGPDTGTGEPAAPVRTRETASPGYRQTLEAAQSNRPGPRHLTPHVQQAITRQNDFLADPANREPELLFTDAVAAHERLTPPAIDDAERIRQAAIARKHAGDQPVRRAFDVA